MSNAPRVRRRPRVLPSIVEVLLGTGAAACAVMYTLNARSSTGVLLDVSAEHVAAIVDAGSGEVTTVEAPGYVTVLPFLEDAYRVVKSPIEYVMAGNARPNHNEVPRLSVRASDGSHVWFEEVRIQYALAPGGAWKVMSDAGGEYMWHGGILDAYARSAMRDAFGRYTAEEIVEQENLSAARQNAKARLDEMLEPHGLMVLELSTSKPGFPNEYESVIQRRQVAEQQLNQIDAEIAQLQASRTARFAKLERDKSYEESQMRAKMRRDLAKAQRDAIRSRAEADREHDDKIRAGRRERDERLSQADANVARYESEAQGMRERAEAMAAQGAMAVRRALVDSLSSVRFEVAPFESQRPGSKTASQTY